jgi:hypothetical protein
MTTPDWASVLPRCDRLDGSSLRIVPAYTEAGRYGEANCITVTDGERTAVYVQQHAEESAMETVSDQIRSAEIAESVHLRAKLDRMRVGMAALQLTCDELKAKNDRLLVEVEILRDRCLANQAQHLELLASPPAPAGYDVSEWNGTGWTQVWRDASD